MNSLWSLRSSSTTTTTSIHGSNQIFTIREEEVDQQKSFPENCNVRQQQKKYTEHNNNNNNK